LQVKKINLDKIHPSPTEIQIFDEENPSLINTSNNSIFSEPVFLQNDNGGYKIVYGFNTVSALKKAGVKYISAFVFDKNYQFLDVIRYVSDFVLKSRPIWPIEIARFLQVCWQKGIPAEQKSEIFNKFSDTDLTYLREKNYLALNDLDPLLQHFLIEKKAPLKTWLMLTELPAVCQILMQNLIAGYHPSLSIFEEIGRNLLEILRRENVQAEILLNELNWSCEQDVRADQGGKKIAELRELVLSRRFPHLTKHHRKIEKALEAIRWPFNIKIEYDKNYEEPGYILRAHIHNVEELTQLLNFFNGPAKAKLEDLLKILG